MFGIEKRNHTSFIASLKKRLEEVTRGGVSENEYVVKRELYNIKKDIDENYPEFWDFRPFFVGEIDFFLLLKEIASIIEPPEDFENYISEREKYFGGDNEKR